MASPVDVGQNAPDTLPADFGEWDSSDSSVAAPADTPAVDSREAAARETPQREFARREAEALDVAKRPNTLREASREFEPARNVTPFPEPAPDTLTSRGFPAPAVRAPRTSPTPAPAAVRSVPDDSKLMQRLKSIDAIVDKHPPVESRVEPIALPTVPLLTRKPDKPLFSSVVAAELETVETEDGPRLLNDLLEEEQERKTRRKWITSACIFGGSLLLVAFQLVHHGAAGKIKHIVVAPQTASTTAADVDPNSILDVKTAASKPSPFNQIDTESQPVEDASAKPAETAPAKIQKQMMQTQLSAPTRLPQDARTVAPSDAPPPAALGGAAIAALNGNNSVGNVFAGSSNANISGPRVVTVSAGVAVGMLVRKAQPVYPSIARSARVQGTVVLQAKISKTGKVTNLLVVSGPPMLRQAAVDAVKTWQYRPYTLNNQPTEIDTTVNVVFTLGG